MLTFLARMNIKQGMEEEFVRIAKALIDCIDGTYVREYLDPLD